MRVWRGEVPPVFLSLDVCVLNFNLCQYILCVLEWKVQRFLWSPAFLHIETAVEA